MRSSGTMDLTKGSVSKKLIAFALPILLTNLLQHLYTVADRVVVGQFAENGEMALAAVGSTSSATTLFLNIFTGLAIGTNVICANLRGARKQKELETCMHSSMLLAVVTGIGVAVLGVLLCKPLLLLLGTPADILDMATLYMRIYFMGVPASLIYNFGANILRAHGDTKRPMYILSLTGLVNVGLNLLLVIGCGRSVDGVAIATIAAQYISAIAVVVILFSPKGTYRMEFGRLRFHGKSILSVVRVGVPCGLNGMVFSLSNLILQSAVNSFNSAVIIAGKTAAVDLSTLVYQVIAAFYTACVSFSGQCYGAGKYKRIDSLALRGIGLCWIFMMVISVLCTLFPRPLLGLFNSNPEVIDAGTSVLLINCWGYMFYTVSEVALGCLRGMGESGVPSFLNLLGICVPRAVWAFLIFPMNRSMGFLFLCYPISWFISALLQGGYYLRCRKKHFACTNISCEK